MKPTQTRLLLAILLLIPIFSRAEIIESVIAIVNDQVITYSELKAIETERINELRRVYENKQPEYVAALQDLKKNLLNNVIEGKILLSRAMQKKYNVDAQIEAQIADIKKQYNINSEEEYIKALASQGLTVEKFRKSVKENYLQQYLIHEEIGAKIKIQNAEIMEYYKTNAAKFSIPAELTINCIFFKKEGRHASELKDRMTAIDAELNATNFEEIAKKNSEWSGGENNFAMGKFKKGELEKQLEEEAMKVKKGGLTSWLETESGWFRLQVKDFIDSHVKEYKDVREEINDIIFNSKIEEKRKEYVEQIKKESFIKIINEYN